MIEMYKYIPRVFCVRASVESLPDKEKEILNRLKGEREIVVTGGLARWVFLEGLRRQGKSVDLREAKQLKDIDLKIGHYGTLPKSEEKIVQKASEIVESILGDLLRENNLVLDFDSMNFSTEEEVISKKTIVALLSNMDITVNELILATKNRVWYLYYTQRCWSHTLKGLGVLGYKEGSVRREKNGIIVPNSNGLYRLLKAFAEGKVRKIVIPKYQMDLYLQHMEKLQKSRKVSKGANLGRYSLILIEKFQKNTVAQQRLMRALRALNLTKQTKFGRWASAQELLDRFSNGNFEFGGLSIGEKVGRKIEAIRKKEENQRKRKQARENCQHKFRTEDCDLCPEKCQIKICGCGKYETNRRELPCNIDFIDGIYSPKRELIVVANQVN